jgi:hypothetical protein
MDRAFGVEIELTGITRAHALRTLRLVGCDIREEDYNHVTRSWWKLVPDGSIQDGFEVVSPILRGQRGMTDIATVVTALDDAGGRVDRRCGLHVHLDCANVGLAEMRSVISQPDRYFKVNLKSLEMHRTLEFRQHSGTRNAAKVQNWLTFTDDFVRESYRLAGLTGTEPEPVITLPTLQPRLAELARLLLAHPEGMNSTTLQQALRIQPHSLRADMTYLRRAGVEVASRRHRRGETIYLIEGAAARTGQPPDGGLFAGVAEETARFYRNRALVLSSNVR